MPPQHRPDVVVIGAGVLGLSIATELTSRGLKVAIVARDLPEDAHSSGFASPWAGCNWCSFADDNPIEQEWDRITYLKLATLAQEHPELCEMIPFYDVWDGQGEGGVPWFKDLVQGYRSLQPTDNIPAPYGNVYRSYVLHAPLYIIHLSTRLRALGVPIIRQRLTSLDEAYDLSSLGLGQGTVPLVVNATGLGALSLLGVQDDKVYPIRGQTVLVKAPEGWNKVCVMKTQSHPTGDPVIDSTAPEPSYIIPRPGPTHQVVLGGSFESLSYSTLPSPQLAERILRKAYALQPSLAGPNGSSWRDIEVIAHNVGLRPARRGGCRLELETRVLGGPKPDLWPGKRVNKPKSQVGVVHAYGIGPAGFQASLGIAEKASDLVMAYLKEQTTASRL